MKKLERKIALVTGSGRGIGQAIAQKPASEGAKAVVNDLDAGPPGKAAGAVYPMCIPESNWISGEVALASGGFVMQLSTAELLST